MATSLALLCVSVLGVGTDQFAEPVRLKAGGDYVHVEPPGYACPTMFDVDGDKNPDLITGQFNNGKLHFFKNVGTAAAPRFAKGSWIISEGKPATVPGVW